MLAAGLVLGLDPLGLVDLSLGLDPLGLGDLSLGSLLRFSEAQHLDSSQSAFQQAALVPGLRAVEFVGSPQVPGMVPLEPRAGQLGLP